MLFRSHVNVGDVVTAGETIGLSGATGRSTGPHLHLEAYQDDKRIDPNRFLLANLDDDALPSAMRAKRTGVESVSATRSGKKSKAKARSAGKVKATRVASKSGKKKSQVTQKKGKSRKRT